MPYRLPLGLNRNKGGVSVTRDMRKLVELIEALRSRRYPTLLFSQGNGVGSSTADLRSVAQTCSLRFIDYREDVLSSESSPVIGSYLRSQFREWLREQARQSGGIFVVNADELISSWPEEERRAFFIDFIHIESSCLSDPTRCAPIVLLSRHVEAFDLPTSERGQGIVASLPMDE